MTDLLIFYNCINTNEQLLRRRPSNPDIMETCDGLGLLPHIGIAIIVVGIFAALQSIFDIIPDVIMGPFGWEIFELLDN